MKFTVVPSLIALSLAALLLPDAGYAQSTRQRLTDLETQLDRIERLLRNTQDNQADLLQRLQTLQEENRELRNQIETLQFEADRGSERERELYLDLDRRLQALESSGAAATAAGGAAVAGGSQVAEAAAYQAAFDLLKEGQYEAAGEGFAKFLATYPNSELRDNAQYWLAETKYVTKDYPVALKNFRLVVEQYPTSRKIPDAWLKIGYCNYELKQWGPARQALTTVTTQFADSTAARLARERLALMDAEGV